MLSFLTECTVNGFPLWIILLICAGVLLASFMDAIAGGGGIISVPVYLMALGNVPTYYILGTNKISAGIGTFFSTARFVKNGLVDWRLCLPGAAISLLGSVCGTWLQVHTPDEVLKYLLLVLLPVIAVITLRGKSWPDEAEPRPYRTRLLIVCCAALLIGCYDGYYGPGTGTFLIIAFTVFAGLSLRSANAQAKVINLTTNLTSLTIFLMSGQAIILLGLAAAACNMAGNYVGSSLAMKQSSKVTRPVIIFVLILLFLKVLGVI